MKLNLYHTINLCAYRLHMCIDLFIVYVYSSLEVKFGQDVACYVTNLYDKFGILCKACILHSITLKTFAYYASNMLNSLATLLCSELWPDLRKRGILAHSKILSIKLSTKMHLIKNLVILQRLWLGHTNSNLHILGINVLLITWGVWRFLSPSHIPMLSSDTSDCLCQSVQNGIYFSVFCHFLVVFRSEP